MNIGELLPWGLLGACVSFIVLGAIKDPPLWVSLREFKAALTREGAATDLAAKLTNQNEQLIELLKKKR